MKRCTKNMSGEPEFYATNVTTNKSQASVYAKGKSEAITYRQDECPTMFSYMWKGRMPWFVSLHNATVAVTLVWLKN